MKEIVVVGVLILVLLFLALRTVKADGEWEIKESAFYRSSELVISYGNGTRKVLRARKDPLFSDRLILYNDKGVRVGTVKPDLLYSDRWEVDIDAVVSGSK